MTEQTRSLGARSRATGESGGRDPSHALIFFRTWLRHPKQLSAVLPSGPLVARAVGEAVELARPGMVLELGGGSGSLTRGILAAGCPADRLLVVEREPVLAEVIRRRFPALEVVEGDAGDCDSLLRERGIERLASVVSSLPMRWFPEELQRRILLPCLERLGEGGSVLQITNRLSSPVKPVLPGLEGERIASVWLNFLPMHLWRYRRR